jgi:Holliday junction resolvase RusA-like endonuclease
MEINFTVYGEPIAQGRGRATVVNGRPVVYDPAKSRDFKSYVRQEALKVKPDVPFQGAVKLTVVAYRAIPSSFGKKKHELATTGEILPITKPDAKNLLAGVEDALKGIVWRDDSLVTDVTVRKRYSDTPRIEVTVKEL